MKESAPDLVDPIDYAVEVLVARDSDDPRVRPPGAVDRAETSQGSQVGSERVRSRREVKARCEL
jgi:hypothetical protein